MKSEMRTPARVAGLSFLAAAAALTPQLSHACACGCGIFDVGQAAPSLIVSPLNGPEFDLSAQHGKVVVINIWATWCPCCQRELPVLNSLYNRYHRNGVEVIGLSADRSHDRDQVIKRMHDLGFPVALLGDAKVNGFGRMDSLPLTYIIDRGGKVRSVLGEKDGELTEKSLDDALRGVLR